MLTNELMRSQLVKVDWTEIEKNCLTYELEEIVSEGFIEIDGCFLSKKLFSYCQANFLGNFEDEISFECFVNSFHMDDYVNERYFEYSIIFSNSIIKKWSEKYDGKLNIIISLDDETLLPTIKFHVKREGLSWLDEYNLDASIQALLITTGEITIVQNLS